MYLCIFVLYLCRLAGPLVPPYNSCYHRPVICARLGLYDIPKRRPMLRAYALLEALNLPRAARYNLGIKLPCRGACTTALLISMVMMQRRGSSLSTLHTIRFSCAVVSFHHHR